MLQALAISTVAASNDNGRKSFVVGATYSTRSACDYDCIFRFKVVARTAKTVTVEYHGKLTRRGIRVWSGVETISPLGSYSMAPVISADKMES